MTTTTPAFHAGIHRTTGTVLDPHGVDTHGTLHLFHSPTAVEDGVLQVAGRLHAVTEHLGLQIERLRCAKDDSDRAVLAMGAAATLRETLDAVRAPVEALARAEVFSSLSSDMQGWVQIDAEQRQELLAPSMPPELAPGLWVNERSLETPAPLVQVFTSMTVDGREVRDVFWPTGVNQTTFWIREQPPASRQWHKPPRA